MAEGLLTLEQVERVNAHVVSVLAEAGLTITATYVCPHRRGDGCHCIKPNPHFLHQAAEQHGIDLRRSFVVGDHPHDVELANRAGRKGSSCARDTAGSTSANWPRMKSSCRTSVRRPNGFSHAAAGGVSFAAANPDWDAADTLRGGGVVAFPTETVYGLGANVFDRAAVQRVFEIKNRPRSDPLIVHVADARQVRDLVRDFPAEARIWRAASGRGR